MTIRIIGKKRTLKRNDDILNMLLRYSVKQVAIKFNLAPMTVYSIAFKNKQRLAKLNKN